MFGSREAYDDARLKMLQYGSDALVNDVLVDRHIIRLARAGAFNFACLAAALALHGIRGGIRGGMITLAAISASLSIGSFFQWLSRYRSHYDRIYTIVTRLELQRKGTAA